ncbi:MAG: IS110 family transposase [Phycisphaerae bacterium]|nr:IS110 family transposase [Phycisphaerae bacterium]
MLFIGLDVHWRTSTVCILDENGKRVKMETLRGSWAKLLTYFERLKQPFTICYEASCGYGYLYDALRKIARCVVVAHPGQLRLIFRSKRKNDRVDAEKLAKLLYLQEVPLVYVPSVEVRSWRQMIECRCRLIDKRTRTKNGIRSLLRSYGIMMPRGLWTRKGRSWLASLELPAAFATVQRDLLLEELVGFDRQVARITKVLDQAAARHPGVIVLRTIPGVGPRTAEAVVAYMDDPKRFGRNKRVGAYFGLVPCQNASAGSNRLGHITRQGPATARKLLVEATWQGIRRSKAIRAYFERIAGGKADRRKIALVATAHHLLRCMHAMLCTGECWNDAA